MSSSYDTFLAARKLTVLLEIVVMPIHTINRQDSVWGDGAVFRPERWMQVLPPQEKLTKGWGNTLAFSDGSRNCVGYKLGTTPRILPCP